MKVIVLSRVIKEQHISKFKETAEKAGYAQGLPLKNLVDRTKGY